MKKTIAIAIMLMALQACGSVGNKSMKDQSASTVNIVRGETTIQEVTAKFGVPLTTTFTENGNKIYTYVYDDASAFTAETVASVVLTWGLAGSKTRGERRELAVLFDHRDIVKNYTVHVSQIEAGTMLFK